MRVLGSLQHQGRDTRKPQLAGEKQANRPSASDDDVMKE